MRPLNLQEISDALGNISYKGVSKAFVSICKNQSQLNKAEKILAELKKLTEG